MYNWRNESHYLKRYIGSGTLNTIVGWSVIFLLMSVGASPLLANLGGYMIGFILGFLLTRNFVFHSTGHVADEGRGYLVVFIISFLLNLLVLKFSLDTLHWGKNISQGLAAISYTIAMYLLTRYFVFRVNYKMPS